MKSLADSIALADFNILKSILLWRTPSLDNFFYFITYFGHWLVVAIITFGLVLFFIKKGRPNLAKYLLASVLGSSLVTLITKLVVNRARPSSDIALYTELLPSFPSAHAALSFALFGFMVFYLWQLKLSSFSRIVLAVMLVIIISLVGFSRLYLGVHYLSDVIGGYLVGLLSLLTVAYLARRRRA
jgi:undecaprenyl-diphosphatase